MGERWQMAVLRDLAAAHDPDAEPVQGGILAELSLALSSEIGQDWSGDW
jgi:hypothetical protein